MTTPDALNLIDQVLARFQGTREDHVNLVEAVRVIREALGETLPNADGGKLADTPAVPKSENSQSPS